MKFAPERLEVAVGDIVTWTNKDLVPHTVTAAGQGIESGAIAPGASWRHVFRRAGEVSYLCRFHPTMKATVVVR